MRQATQINIRGIYQIKIFANDLVEIITRFCKRYRIIKKDMIYFLILLRATNRKEDGDDGIFDTEQEAEDYFYEWMSNYNTGGEVLHLSNPGDYPLEMVEQEPDYEIVEI
ncbi:MAG: hypothetical protein NC124_19270 [Clostridium sp.]|nr:hypothetical protein [Clostridium sp.]